MQALMSHIGSLDYRGLLKRDCGSWADYAKIDEMVNAERERNGDPRGPFDCALKPHGRKAWNLYMEHGCKVDLSVMPRITTDSRESQNYMIVDNSVVFVTSIIANSFVSYERVFNSLGVGFDAHLSDSQQICGI